MVRDAILDEGVPQDLLPSVSNVKNYLDHQQNISSSHHGIDAFQKQLEGMWAADAVRTYDAFIYSNCIQELVTTIATSTYSSLPTHSSAT